jgi:hypothetical protein
MDPKKWPYIYGHSTNPVKALIDSDPYSTLVRYGVQVNRIPVIAPILGQRKRGPFYEGVSPSKIGLVAPC